MELCSQNRIFPYRVTPNPNKLEALCGRWGLTPVLDGVVFPLKEQVCSLGVLQDPAFLLGKQVVAVAKLKASG